jgi:hypothetical protein
MKPRSKHKSKLGSASNDAPQKRPNTKRTGEFSETAFLLKATGLGFAVTKPWGDSERYDFILDAGPRLWRVQVKGTASLRAGGYDVLVAYIITRDAWHLFGQKSKVARLGH